VDEILRCLWCKRKDALGWRRGCKKKDVRREDVVVGSFDVVSRCHARGIWDCCEEVVLCTAGFRTSGRVSN